LIFCSRPTKTFNTSKISKGRRIAIVVLGNPQKPAVDRYIDRIIAAVNAATPGSFTEVEIPYDAP
jgi:hypothetical protein